MESVCRTQHTLRSLDSQHLLEAKFNSLMSIELSEASSSSAALLKSAAEHSVGGGLLALNALPLSHWPSSGFLVAPCKDFVAVQLPMSLAYITTLWQRPKRLSGRPNVLIVLAMDCLAQK